MKPKPLPDITSACQDIDLSLPDFSDLKIIMPDFDLSFLQDLEITLPDQIDLEPFEIRLEPFEIDFDLPGFEIPDMEGLDR